MKTCLVLGASGFIGSHIVDHFLSDHYDVIGVDVMTVNRQQTPGYRHYAGAITDELLQLLFTQNRIDTVVFAAGRASVQASFQSPVTDHQENVMAFLQVAEALRRYAPSAYLMLLSSAAVYGNPSSLPIHETAHTKPISPYGFHKLQAELIAQEYATCFQLRISALRLFSCYGEGQRKLLLWDLCKKMEQPGTLELKGKGNESRDFIHVQDVASFVLHLATNPPMGFSLFNVASGMESSIREIAEKLVENFDPKRNVDFEGKENTGNPDNWCANIEAMKGTGFTPAVELEEGIRRYARWYLSL
jgi:UDP-glucose 4-epimerase